MGTAAAGFAGAAFGKALEGAGRSRPNILFVFADQWRRDAVGIMGRDPVPTPHIDAFSRQSLLSTNAISGCPVCSPFRAALMSGRFPDETGMITNCAPNHGQLHLKAEERCIAECYADAGYQTAYIGKWHLDVPSVNKTPRPNDGAGGWDTYTPPGPERQGWNWWYAYNTFDEHLKPHYWSNSEKRIEHKGWSVEHETDVAVDWMKNIRRKDRPFIMTVSWNPPHPPYNLVPDHYKQSCPDSAAFTKRPNYEDLSPESRAYETIKKKMKYFGFETFPEMAQSYFSAITGVDAQFQRLLDALKEEDIGDNTIVVLTSDHGDMMGSHGLIGKTFFYEESVGIPFIVRWPGQIAARKDPVLINGWDIMPTLLGLAGLPVPSTVSGADLSGYMLGKTPVRPDSTYMRQPTNLKYGADSGWRAVRTERHTLVSWSGEKEKAELYDLKKDPYQMNPVSWGGGQDELIEQLYGKLKDWLVKAKDPAIKHYS